MVITRASKDDDNGSRRRKDTSPEKKPKGKKSKKVKGSCSKPVYQLEDENIRLNPFEKEENPSVFLVKVEMQTDDVVHDPTVVRADLNESEAVIEGEQTSVIPNEQKDTSEKEIFWDQASDEGFCSNPERKMLQRSMLEHRNRHQRPKLTIV